MAIKQLKLVTGEELICRVVEEDELDIVVKDALNIVCNYTELNVRYYTFRPFMIYQDEGDLSIIRYSSVVAYANPSLDLLKEYKVAINELHSMTKAPTQKSSRDSDSANVIKLFDGPIH